METSVAERFISSRLKADAALTALVGAHVYNTRRPAAFPCVLFHLQAPRDDLMVLGGVRVWANLLYVVRGIAETTSYEGTLLAIADRIDAVLPASHVTLPGGGVVWVCVRERPFQLPEVTEGHEFRHLGAEFRIQAR